MRNLVLSNEQWGRIRHHFPEESKPRGSRGRPPVSARGSSDLLDEDEAYIDGSFARS